MKTEIHFPEYDKRILKRYASANTMLEKYGRIGLTSSAEVLAKNTIEFYLGIDGDEFNEEV